MSKYTYTIQKSGTKARYSIFYGERFIHGAYVGYDNLPWYQRLTTTPKTAKAGRLINALAHEMVQKDINALSK